MFATKAFRTDERVIEVPEELMITAGKVADMDKYSKLLKDSKFFPTPFELLTLFFCMEDEEASSYAPYLKMLPKSFTTPAYENKSLNPLDLPVSVRDFWTVQQSDLQGSWRRISEVAPFITHEKFLWAWHVVNTRCIYVENKPHTSVDNSAGDTIAVIPFVDMLNHDPSAQCLATFERYKNKYVVRASHYVHDDQQVTVCYGPHDNARLWIEYGFTLPNNPNGKVALEHALLIALAKKVGVDVSPLHEQALQEAGLPSTLYLSDASPSWALRVNMKILMLSPSDIRRWRELVYREKERPASVCSSDDEELAVDEGEQAEREKLKLIIAELRKAMVSKLNKCALETKWMWEEQVAIVDAVLSSFKNCDTAVGLSK